MTDYLRYYPEIISSSELPLAMQEVQRELWRLSALVNTLIEGYLEETYVAPARPRKGMVRFADGTKWNPGAGVGVYVYHSSTWNKL